jgi:transposase
MLDTELYRQILGITDPWSVSEVKLDVGAQRVDVWVTHAEGVRFACPTCGTELPGYDHAEARSWRHLDTCQFQTFLHAQTPRVQCPTHGVVQARVPWAEPRSRFTLLFERLAIDVLKSCSLTAAGRLLDLSWDEAWGIMERAVARGQERKAPTRMRYVGVDEKSIRKGHRYHTLVVDLETSTVEAVRPDRDQESLEGYWRTLTAEQKAGIEGIAMDMWPAYIAATRAQIPNATAKIVFDRFHVMQYLNKAVDTVRRQEHRALRAQGDDRLTGTKYLWLYGRERVPQFRQRAFAALRRTDLKVARAWAMKEQFRRFWGYVRVGWARAFWKAWYWWATHSRLRPMREVAGVLQRHLDNILTYVQHRITNAPLEGINAKIQKVKQWACGFRNDDHFKTAILFHCGGLNLYPC